MFRLTVAVVAFAFAPLTAADPWITIEGGEGPGKGKHVVLVSGDEEYRSEEALPQLAKILAKHHGFTCTVLFAIDPKDGCVAPNVTNNIPGTDKLKSADLLVIFTRFRNLPDDQMKPFADYLDAGKPVVGLRTATHAFNMGGNFKRFSNGSKEKDWEGGFGKKILGEQWVNHHGKHGTEGTRGIPAKGQESHPILKGIKDGEIFGTTDVYTAKPAGDSVAIVMGQVTETLKPDSKAVEGKKNDPMMPVAWTKTYETEAGKKGKVFTTTMGASQDLQWEGTRRMVVNGCFWALGMEDKIGDGAKVDLVGEFKPTPFAFRKPETWKPGLKQEEYAK
jgi:type 1 glutamine amidotransferase